MKNLIIVLSFIVALAFAGNAQSSAYTMTSSGDTVTNTGTKTVTLKLTENYETVSLQLKVVKISGTVAGTVTLQGSLDGVNYETVLAAATVNNANTHTATDVATQTKIFIINDCPYLYLRFSHTGSGTMASRLYGYLLPRR